MSAKPRRHVIAGLVLAGGLSRRMGGGDKSLLDLNGMTLAARSVARLAPQVARLAISSNLAPSSFADLGVPVLSDLMPGFQGPLAGILTGLEWASDQGLAALSTVAVDTPFFPDDLVARLAAGMAAESRPIALAQSAGRTHPVFGLWMASMTEPLRAFLLGGSRKVLDFATTQGFCAVDFPVDPGAVDPFFNVNTPADADRARAMLEPTP